MGSYIFLNSKNFKLIEGRCFMNYIDIIKKGRQLNSEKEIYYLSNGQNEYLVKLLKKNENEYSNIIQ